MTTGRAGALLATLILLGIVLLAPAASDAPLRAAPDQVGLAGGCEILLFHSVLGLRRGVLEWADRLRSHGYEVRTPDFFKGATFSDFDEAMQALEERGGIPAYMEWTMVEGRRTPEGAVMMGFSNGAGSAQLLAATQPGTRGAVLMHGALPLEALSVQTWPEGVPVQVHYAEEDPFRHQEGVDALQNAVEAAEARFQLFSYPGHGHLFADPELPDFHAHSAEMMEARVLQFLEKACGNA